MKFGAFDSQKIIKIIATICRITDFKAKMHQNRFQLGSAPDPAVGLTALPRPSPSWNKGDLYF